MRNFILFLLSISLLFSLQMIKPFNISVSDGQEFYFGKIGPGQTFSIILDPKVLTGGVHGLGGYYDYAYVSNLSYGWKTKSSDWLGNPLFVTITAPKNAEPGNYSFFVNVLDKGNQEGLKNISFKGIISITKDVFNYSISKQKYYITGKPARVYIKVFNKVNTGDVFVVKSSNLYRFKYFSEKYIPPNSSETFVYTIYSEEEETYNPIFEIYPKSASNLNKSINLTIYIEPDPITDLKSLNKGILVFPVMNHLIYSFAAFISNFF